MMHALTELFNMMTHICTKYDADQVTPELRTFPQYELWSSDILKEVDNSWKKHMSKVFKDAGEWGSMSQTAWEAYVLDAVAVIRSHSAMVGSQEGLEAVREVANQMADNAKRSLVMDVGSFRFPTPLITPAYILDLHDIWCSVDGGLTLVS
jgi:hypothetical protein